MDVLDRFDEGADDPITLRRVLVHLREPSVLEVALDDMLGLDEDPERLEATAAFSERMLGVARRPPEVCVARLLAAVVAERRGDPLEGEAHLHLAAEADAGWGPAIDRLAWYASDRGDAAEAVRLLRLLGADPDEDEDLRTVEPFSGTLTPAAARPGSGGNRRVAGEGLEGSRAVGGGTQRPVREIKGR